MPKEPEETPEEMFLGKPATPRNPSPARNKVYLGDGVYVALNEDEQIVLSAENGLYATDIIYLEPEVFGLLQRYVKGWKPQEK